MEYWENFEGGKYWIKGIDQLTNKLFYDSLSVSQAELDSFFYEREAEIAHIDSAINAGELIIPYDTVAMDYVVPFPQVHNAQRLLFLKGLKEIEFLNENELIKTVELLLKFLDQLFNSIPNRILTFYHGQIGLSYVGILIELIVNDPAISNRCRLIIHEMNMNFRKKNFNILERYYPPYLRLTIDRYKNAPEIQSLIPDLYFKEKSKSLFIDSLKYSPDQLDSLAWNHQEIFMDGFTKQVDNISKPFEDLYRENCKRNFSKIQFERKIEEIPMPKFDLQNYGIERLKFISENYGLFNKPEKDDLLLEVVEFYINLWVWVVATGLPTDQGWDMFQRGFSEFVKYDLAVISLALRLYEEENHTWPNTLSHPFFDKIRFLNKDPFNNFRPFRMARKGNNIVIYSYGVDRKNNHGNDLLSPIIIKQKLDIRETGDPPLQLNEIGINLIPFY